MIFAQRGPTMVPRNHRWLTLCKGGSAIGKLIAEGVIYSDYPICVIFYRHSSCILLSLSLSFHVICICIGFYPDSDFHYVLFHSTYLLQF